MLSTVFLLRRLSDLVSNLSRQYVYIKAKKSLDKTKGKVYGGKHYLKATFYQGIYN